VSGVEGRTFGALDPFWHVEGFWSKGGWQSADDQDGRAAFAKSEIVKLESRNVFVLDGVSFVFVATIGSARGRFDWDTSGGPNPLTTRIGN